MIPKRIPNISKQTKYKCIIKCNKKGGNSKITTAKIIDNQFKYTKERQKYMYNKEYRYILNCYYFILAAVKRQCAGGSPYTDTSPKSDQPVSLMLVSVILIYIYLVIAGISV